MIALTIGFVSWAVSLQQPPRQQFGRVLTEADDPELLAIVDRLCAIADIARPEVRLVNQRQPNSWVVQYRASSPRLYLTTALVQLLTTEELNAVIAHELSHIANRDALVMSVVGMPSAVMRRSTAGGLGAVFVVMIGIVRRGRDDDAVALPGAGGRCGLGGDHRSPVGAGVGADEGLRRADAGSVQGPA